MAPEEGLTCEQAIPLTARLVLQEFNYGVVIPLALRQSQTLLVRLVHVDQHVIEYVCVTGKEPSQRMSGCVGHHPEKALFPGVSPNPFIASIDDCFAQRALSSNRDVLA